MKSFKVTLIGNATVIVKGDRLWSDTTSVQFLREKDVKVQGEGKYDTVALYPIEQIKSVVELYKE